MKPLQSSCASMKSAVQRVSERLPGVPLAEVVSLRLLHIVHTGLDHFEETWIKPHRLSNSEFRTLMMLYSSAKQQVHPSELCQWASQKPTNMTRIIDNLLKRKLVTRSPSDEDRRYIIVAVTPTGVRLVRKILLQLNPKVKALFHSFSAVEHRQLNRLAEKLLHNIDAMDAVQE